MIIQSVVNNVHKISNFLLEIFSKFALLICGGDNYCIFFNLFFIHIFFNLFFNIIYCLKIKKSLMATHVNNVLNFVKLVKIKLIAIVVWMELV